jgi:hypothetical protein
VSASSSESLPDAALSGDRLAALRALRQVLAEQIRDCDSARDIGSLSKQLRDTLTEIDSLGGAAEPTQEDLTLDELADRRSRISDAAVVPRARRRLPS